jgi:hypothetical protein
MRKSWKPRMECPCCQGGKKPPGYKVRRRADGVELCAYCRGAGYLKANHVDLMHINDELAKLNWQSV